MGWVCEPTQATMPALQRTQLSKRNRLRSKTYQIVLSFSEETQQKFRALVSHNWNLKAIIPIVYDHSRSCSFKSHEQWNVIIIHKQMVVLFLDEKWLIFAWFILFGKYKTEQTSIWDLYCPLRLAEAYWPLKVGLYEVKWGSVVMIAWENGINGSLIVWNSHRKNVFWRQPIIN